MPKEKANLNAGLETFVRGQTSLAHFSEEFEIDIRQSAYYTGAAAGGPT
jgi:hypothetical protein